MVKISELSLEDRQHMITDISSIMICVYKIDKESIDAFWNIVGIGIEAQNRI